MDCAWIAAHSEAVSVIDAETGELRDGSHKPDLPPPKEDSARESGLGLVFGAAKSVLARREEPLPKLSRTLMRRRK